MYYKGEIGFIITCKCGCGAGYNVYNEDDDYYISCINNKPKGFLNKLKAISLILKNRYIESHEIILETKDFDEINKYINKGDITMNKNYDELSKVYVELAKLTGLTSIGKELDYVAYEELKNEIKVLEELIKEEN